MLKSIEDISPTRKRLKIEVTTEAIEKEFGSAFERLRAQLKLPGFRPGKVPMAILEKRFGKEVQAEVLEKVVSDSYHAVIKEAGITPVAMPVFEEKIAFERNSPLSMTLTVEIRPKLENPVYEGMKVREIAVAVTEEDIETMLKRLQEEKTPYVPSEDAIKPDDVAVIDITAEATPPLTLNDYLLRVGDESFPAEFSTGLTGKKKGDELTLTASFPGTFHIKEFAGRTLELKIFIKEVKRPNPPAIDDEFAKDVGLDDLKTLREHLSQEILKSKNETVLRIQKAEVMKKVIEANEFEVPESLIEQEIAHLMERTRLSGSQEDEAGLRFKFRPSAEKNVRAALLIDIIGDKEEIRITDEEVKNEIQSLTRKLRLSPENVMKYFITKDGSLDGLKHMLFEERVLKLLIEKAIIEKQGTAQ